MMYSMSLTSSDFRFAFLMITSLFFMWGFVHNLDPILIPHLKKSFSLTTLQSSLVDSAVFISYFIMALPAGLIMKKFGYKAGIITGLVLFAGGSYLFIPAADTGQYLFFLTALFIIACGLTILETAANPYASLLGNPEKATQRLNFAQSFNGLAATLAPIIGARAILTEGYSQEQLSTMTEAAKASAMASEAATVKMPYFILGSSIVVLAVIFFFLKLPVVQTNTNQKLRNVFTAFRYKHLTAAVAAQFFYVGAQVCVFSFFILYATRSAGIDKLKAADYLGWGCGMAFMVGRFIGTFIMRYIQPAKLLLFYSIINMALCFVAISISGMLTVFAVIGIAFFMSIMFPTIFSLGIKDLGEDTAIGSSLIIMSIIGGALLPLVFGYMADVTGNIQLSYSVPFVCFAVVAWFAQKGYKLSTKDKENVA